MGTSRRLAETRREMRGVGMIGVAPVSLLWAALVFATACANEAFEPVAPARGGAGAAAMGAAGAGVAAVPGQVAMVGGGSMTSAPVAATAAAVSSMASSASPAARSGAAGAAPASTAAPAASGGGSSSGAAGAAADPNAMTPAIPDLSGVLPPLSTPETRIPAPDNPTECPATAPEDPFGDCLGLPIYVECNYGTYTCICDWYHWLCAG